jgi:nitrous oxide reductase accessory protein NosL
MMVKENGEKLCACCPHCGILLLQQMEDVGSALTPDFLHGRRLNVFQAWFVVGSDVRPCCLPSTLCFATEDDAEKFQRGFGGEVFDYDQAAERLKAAHYHG